MTTPFKLKYKNSAFPFKSPVKQNEEETLVDGDEGDGGEIASKAAGAVLGAITSSMNQPAPKRTDTQEGFTQMKIGV